jgi:hypothetical protein
MFNNANYSPFNADNDGDEINGCVLVTKENSKRAKMMCTLDFR